jgi:hypothetical protein
MGPPPYQAPLPRPARLLVTAGAVARPDDRATLPSMFAVDKATAEAVRRTFEESGELAAAVELRRCFPGIATIAAARDCARIIASWQPLPERPARKGRRRQAAPRRGGPRI